jgi:hypothetical protein
MPGLRDRVIAIICVEWPNPENKVEGATIYERLQSADAEASEHDIREVLIQLANHDEITLVFEPGGTASPTVVGVHSKLCP